MGNDDACARCGRRRAFSDVGEVGEPLPDLDEGSTAAAPWVSIAGVHVCPDCLTDDERHEARLRLHTAIEHEIERRSELGAVPMPGEGALINYTMELREQEFIPPPPLPWSWVVRQA